MVRWRTTLRWLGRKCPPGSLPFLALLAVALAGYSARWTGKAVRHNNLDDQGMDVTSHALMIYWQAHALPPSLLGEDAVYPKCAHALAAQLAPLYHGNVLQAMRCAALVALFAMLAAQYTLLCRFAPAGLAVVFLALWQRLCNETFFANLDHFAHANYQYAQAVGVAGFWLAVVFAAAPTPGVGMRWLMAVVGCSAATFAYACHLVPGVVAFGTLVAYYGLRFLRGSRVDGLRCLVSAAWAAAVVLSSEQWRVMASARGAFNDGWLPFAHLGLLLTWVPTLLAALGRVAWRTRRNDRRPVSDAELVLVAGLLTAGLLQGYFAYEWGLLGTTSAYTVKKFFFFTFPLASLLWFYWLTAWLRQTNFWGRGFGWFEGYRPGFVWGVATVLAWALLNRTLGVSSLRPGVEPGHDPLVATRLLEGRRATTPPSYYYDPRYPMGSLFATVAGLRVERDIARRCQEALQFRNLAPVPLATLVRDGHFACVMLPADADARAVFGFPVPTESDGPLQRCDLRPLYRPYPPAPPRETH